MAKQKFWQLPFDVPAWRESPTRYAMTLPERAVYFELLCYAWIEGSLPSDHKVLAAICGVNFDEVAVLLPRVLEHFEADDQGRYINLKLEEVRALKTAIYKTKVENGKRGGRPPIKPAGSVKITGRLATVSNYSSLASSESSSEQQQDLPLDQQAGLGRKKPAGSNETTGRLLPSFEAFWGIYPRKVAKQDALKAFQQVITTPEDFRLLLENTRSWVDAEFSRRDSDVIPYAATYLRRRDWDEPPSPHVGAKETADSKFEQYIVAKYADKEIQ